MRPSTRKQNPPDRHHVAELLTPVDIHNTRTELDFSLHPFNRRDEYKVNVFFTYSDSPNPIKLSSSHSTKFIDMAKRDFVDLIAEHAIHICVVTILTLLVLLFLIPKVVQVFKEVLPK